MADLISTNIHVSNFAEGGFHLSFFLFFFRGVDVWLFLLLFIQFFLLRRENLIQSWSSQVLLIESFSSSGKGFSSRETNMLYQGEMKTFCFTQGWDTIPQNTCQADKGVKWYEIGITIQISHSSWPRKLFRRNIAWNGKIIPRGRIKSNTRHPI